MTIWVDSCDPAYFDTVNGGSLLDNLSPGIVLLLYAIFSLVFIYSTFADYVKWYRSLHGQFAYRPVGIPIDVINTCILRVAADELTRGDKQPINTFNSVAAKQSHCVKSFDDGTSFNENTFGTSGYYTASSNYSDHSYKSKIVGGGSGSSNVKVAALTRSTLQGTESEADRGYHDVHRPKTIKKSQEASMQDDHHDPRFRETPHTEFNLSPLKVQYPPAKSIQRKYLDSDLDVLKQVQRESETQNSNNDGSKQQKLHQSITKPLSPSSLPEPKKVSTTGHGYNKSTYTVLIGDSVKVYSTSVFAALPRNNKFLVKERHQDLSGVTRVKLTLKSTEKESCEHDVSKCIPDEDVEKDGANSYGEKIHYRENLKRSGYVIYTCDQRFRGDIRYPLPNNKATDLKIGKGGNGFVFTIYHERKQYAVKKTVYRPNEINVHSALKHENILPLVAVLIGEKHERHSGRFYCFHFMPKMDYDLRQILSTKEVGCLKHFYNHCSAHMEANKWDTAYKNVKFILKETLKALAYLHNNGYVHRDVKASNIMIKMRCQCQPLSCICKNKFQVKLGDFDSAGTVPGLGITEPTDQIIKFASILPLGTPGYRAPEVSMHITLSGPYETLYTAAVDMWSFGCLCLNICIGKTAALKQREEASLLLSLTHPTCSQELWEKTTKIKELEKLKPFSHDLTLIKLVRDCLQVKSAKRPNAESAMHSVTW